MNLLSDIAILDLLRQREAEFMVVWQCEQQLKQLLEGADYPLSQPVELPSQKKISRKKQRSAASAPTSVTDTAAAPLATCRKLVPDRENAYHIVYRKMGVEESSFQTDHNLITTLLKLHGQEFQVLKLQTVNFQDLDNWQIVDTLIN